MLGRCEVPQLGVRSNWLTRASWIESPVLFFVKLQPPSWTVTGLLAIAKARPPPQQTKKKKDDADARDKFLL